MNVQTNPSARIHIRYGLGVLLVFATGVAVRFAPRHWTPLPFNPDGFRFAAQAEQAAASGQLAVDSIGAHGFSFPMLLSQLQLITDTSALTLTQPVIAVAGTIPCLFAFVFGRRIARRRNWSDRRALTVATVAGLVLATNGVYLRRSAAVSYEVLGILFVVVSAVALHRVLVTYRVRWLALLVPCLAVLPVTHHLSSMMAALTLTALTWIHLHRSPTTPTVVTALPVIILFWLYFAIYYIVTRPPYFGDLATKPGLFFAWLLLLPAFVLLFRTAKSRTLRFTFAFPFSLGFAIVIINRVTDVFPGTAATHPRVTLYVAPLAVLVALGVWGIPTAIDNIDIGPVVLALFLGPITFVGFALTAGLSPEYFLFARRTQTFLHLSLIVAAGVAVANVGWSRRSTLGPALKTALPVVLLVCSLVSLPIAFAGPPVLPYESTTTPTEFETITFADEYIDDAWTSDGHLTRVASEYYNAGGQTQPTFGWLQGASPPDCSVIISKSWTTAGAEAYPGNPLLVERAEIDAVTTTGQQVYSVNDQRIVRPRGVTGPC